MKDICTALEPVWDSFLSYLLDMADLLMYVWVTFDFLIFFCVPGDRRCNNFAPLKG